LETPEDFLYFPSRFYFHYSNLPCFKYGFSLRAVYRRYYRRLHNLTEEPEKKILRVKELAEKYGTVFNMVERRR